MQPTGYEEHVKAIFRPRDRQSMQFAFDLWSYDDVAAMPTTSSRGFGPARCPVTALDPKSKSTRFSVGSMPVSRDDSF
jgi:hypothetical protein